MTKKSNGLGSILNFAEETLSKGSSELKKALEEHKVSERLDAATKTVMSTEVGKKASKLSGDASNALDEISGKKLLALVEERLTIQDTYNDILATKLEEALQRIEELEQRLEGHEHKKVL
ncbi:MAG: hypothetical protein CME63_04615 [Halobacteriovoraceae bacterium]|nr:hypothetical protein [Halobacteriovoraceae bacterium]|tara:strand:+ start:39711 stop:40070 length:360 start_codon:yes stop_codon:yes gene_type:complete